VPTCRHEEAIEAFQHGGVIVQKTNLIRGWSVQNKSILRQRSTRPY
jgi:hypothetical protein